MYTIKRLLVHQKGLSLLEAMLAILIVGISVTSILTLQGVLSRGVFSAHALVDRIPYMKSMFAQADRDKFYEKQGPQEKKIEDPVTTLRYTVTTPSDAQKFKSYPHIVIEKVEAEWPSLVRDQKEVFIMFRFYPKEKEQPAS